MSRAAQLCRNSVQEWLPKGGKQQLCWVAVVSCVLLIVVQAHKIIVSRFPSASDAAAVEPENAPPAVAALPEADDAKSDVSAPVTVAQSTERGEPVSTSDDSMELAESPPRDEVTSSEQTLAASPAQGASPETPAPVDNAVIVKQVFAAFGGEPARAVAVEAQEPVDVGAKKLPLFAIIRRDIDRRTGRFRDIDARNRALVVLFGSPAETLTASTASNAEDSVAEDSANPQKMPAAELASENVAAENATTDGDPTAALPSAENSSSVVESASTGSADNAPALDQVASQPSDSVGSTQAADVAELPAAELVIVNPLENGGVVLFLVDGEMLSLSPGESQTWPADRDRQIAFHRGESFGDMRTMLRNGHYTFRVGAQGWELVAEEQESPR